MKKFAFILITGFSILLLFSGCDRFLEVFYPAWDTREEMQDQFLHDVAVEVNLDATIDPGMADVYIAVAECYYDGDTWSIDPDGIVFRQNYWGSSSIYQSIALNEGANYLIVAWYDSNSDGYPNAINIAGEGIIAETIGAGTVDDQYFFPIDQYSASRIDVEINLIPTAGLDWFVTSALHEYVSNELND